MIEMDYVSERKFAVLDKGIYKKLYWVILSIGTHPCAYIGLPKGHKFYNKSYDDIDIECHGGLTYSTGHLRLNPFEKNLWWIGWDYAHAGDYLSFSYNIKYDKKWSTKEIKKEVIEFINELSRN